MENVFIFGSNGQDGQLLTSLLENDSYKYNLILFSRNKVVLKTKSKIKEFSINNNFEYIEIINRLFAEFNPNLIFYFAAIHFSALEEVKIKNKVDIDSMIFTNYFLPTYIINFLEINSLKSKFLYTSSSLIFSNSDQTPQDEKTKRKPSCIYSKQKVMFENFVVNLNTNLLDTYIAIVYNHESIYRKSKFFTKKVISFCSEFRNNESNSKLKIFNKNQKIDMGYAPEFVQGMFTLANSGRSGSYIFSTNKLIKVEDFVGGVLSFYNLDFDVIDFNSIKPRSNNQLLGINKKIKEEINWHPKFLGSKLIKKLCEDYENHQFNEQINLF